MRPSHDSTWAATVRSVGVGLAADSTIASAWAWILRYWPSPTSESTSVSRPHSSTWPQSCTIDQTLKALARRSSSMGGAASISFSLAAHQALAAAALPSFVPGVPSYRQEMVYILPRCFLNHRHLDDCQVISSLRAMATPLLTVNAAPLTVR